MDSQNEHVKAYVQGHKLINGFNKLIASDLNELYAQKFLLRDSDALQQEFGNFGEEKKIEFTKRNIYQLIEDNVKLFKEYKEKGNIEECLEIKEKMKKEEEEEERKQKEERLASSIVLDENYEEDGIGGGNDNEENKGSDPFPTFDDDREQEDDAVKENEEGSESRNFLKSSANFGLMDDFMGKEEGNDNDNGDMPKVMEFPHVVSEEIVEKDIRDVSEEDGDKKEEEIVEEKKPEVVEDKQPEVIIEEKKEEVVTVEDNQQESITEEKKEEIVENNQPDIAEKKEEIIEEIK